MNLIGLLSQSPSLRHLADTMNAGGWSAAHGIVGSSTVFVSGVMARLTRRPVVLLVAHLDDADEAMWQLTSAGMPAIHLPAMELLPGESAARLDLFAERLDAQRTVLSIEADAAQPVIVTAIAALMQGVPDPARLDEHIRVVTTGDHLPPADLVRWLDSAGYKRVTAIEEPGEFAMRGGILDVFTPGEHAGPMRLDFFGDEVERITSIDIDTMGSLAPLDRARLVCASLDAASKATTSFIEIVPRSAVAIIAEIQEVTEQGRGYFARAHGHVFGPPAVFKSVSDRCHAVCELNEFSRSTRERPLVLPVGALPEFPEDVKAAVDAMARLTDNGGGSRGGGRVIAPCQTPGDMQRLGELLRESDAPGASLIEPMLLGVHRGFIWGGDGASASGAGAPAMDSSEPHLIIAPYHELIHRYTTRRSPTRLRAARAMDTFLEFAEGDFVVHAEHGIAKFIGLTMMKPQQVRAALGPGVGAARMIDDDEPQEYLTLEFSGRTKLHVPATRIDLVQKYVGGFRGKPELSTIGGVKWRNQKQRTSESVRELAAEMLRVRAAREAMPGVRYAADTPWQKEFEDQFAYEETEDQLAAMAAIKRDMQAERPMDRLICGDVGFGKTELAIRAAFKAAEFGKQVAVLVPTTVLADQHERTFRSRLAGFPFRVESLSRFKTDREINETLAAVRKGQIDIIIGTHRLLSKDVKFADLGLVVIDEEQRFGVEHKDQLLRLRMTADVMTLSATPIPRTLHMSMLGLRDISSLATPPLDRQAVVTEVIPWNPRRIETAIRRELAREGQIYYVHNRVYDILSAADEVRKLAPDARIVVGHGQMGARELEDVMLRFTRREADILVCTTIIESGIDIPTANTMLIADAHRFGLADLHQLRGRVGRYKHRAYCYLLTPTDRPMTDVARQRLKAVEQYSALGAGFKIAMRDLEIRGAGNLLGKEQSGHIAAVGYEMYCRLLDQAVKSLKDERDIQPSQTTLDLGVSGSIPRTYIPSDARRMDAYRRLCHAASGEQLEQTRGDLLAAYGPLPTAVESLFTIAEVRILAAEVGAMSVVVRPPDVIFRTDDPARIAERLRGDGSAPGAVTILPPKSNEQLCEVYFRPPPKYLEPDTLMAVLRKRLAVNRGD